VASEKKAFEAFADTNDVTVHRGDGSALVLKPGEPYETAKPDEIALLEGAAFVKSVAVAAAPKAPSPEKGGN